MSELLECLKNRTEYKITGTKSDMILNRALAFCSDTKKAGTWARLVSPAVRRKQHRIQTKCQSCRRYVRHLTRDAKHVIVEGNISNIQNM